MSIRIFLHDLIGVFAMSFDASHGILIGDSIVVHVVVVFRVTRKVALCLFYSKGGIFGIPMVQVPLGISCCCLI